MNRSRKLQRQPGFGGLAFGQLSARLHRFLLRRLRHAQYAQDLEQEVYVRLLRLSNEELVRSPEAYVYRIASNLVSRFAQRERQGPVDFDSPDAADLAARLSDESASPEEICEEQDRERRLAQAVAQLPAMQKAVFILARYQGLAHAEIAERLGISAHTVKKHMLRAICRCREALAE